MGPGLWQVVMDGGDTAGAPEPPTWQLHREVVWCSRRVDLRFRRPGLILTLYVTVRPQFNVSEPRPPLPQSEDIHYRVIEKIKMEGAQHRELLLNKCLLEDLEQGQV